VRQARQPVLHDLRDRALPWRDRRALHPLPDPPARGTLRTPFPRDHLIRGGVGVVSLWMWFYSFSLLPIATATTLNYMSSIWIA
jgi:drug/metabolite transporter (DMT)-like permease